MTTKIYANWNVKDSDFAYCRALYEYQINEVVDVKDVEKYFSKETLKNVVDGITAIKIRSMKDGIIGLAGRWPKVWEEEKEVKLDEKNRYFLEKEYAYNPESGIGIVFKKIRFDIYNDGTIGGYSRRAGDKNLYFVPKIAFGITNHDEIREKKVHQRWELHREVSDFIDDKGWSFMDEAKKHDGAERERIEFLLNEAILVSKKDNEDWEGMKANFKKEIDEKAIDWIIMGPYMYDDRELKEEPEQFDIKELIKDNGIDIL